MATSRAHASELIAAGRVKVAGALATKPATQVTTDADVYVVEDPNDPGYASRGAHKLAGALASFGPHGLTVEGRRCLDAGASTGGFTDVLLRAGAREVVAVDVGYGQLIWRLQNDERVRVHDRTNIRDITPDLLGGPVDVVVGDLSFISLELVLDALIGVSTPEADLALMVKPQFEVGKERLGKGGVVRDPAVRPEAVSAFGDASARRCWGARAVATSKLPWPSGNVEFFLWLRRGPATIGAEEIAVETGAQTSVVSEKVDP
jgi:23S rRNA (cytidine1920-2'-O)/16S rRNA (cytidine1409-2'-O)-methyltransferase